jgi:O-antigen ligase
MLIFLAIAVGSVVTYLVLTNPTILERFQESSRGDLSGRQVILPAAIDMMLQRPVIGWQPIVYWEELGRRVGQIWGARDAHNMILHVLLELGLVGAIPFLLGVGFCVLSAWRARQGTFGNLPLALLTMTLVANLSHTFLARKPQWMVFALAIAAGYAARRSLASAFLIRQPLRSSGRALKPAYAGQVRPRHF